METNVCIYSQAAALKGEISERVGERLQRRFCLNRSNAAKTLRRVPVGNCYWHNATRFFANVFVKKYISKKTSHSN